MDYDRKCKWYKSCGYDFCHGEGICQEFKDKKLKKETSRERINLKDDDEKELFVEVIMDLLIVIDLDNVSKDLKKENRMRNELLRMDFEQLNDKYNQAYDLLRKQQEIESMDRLLKEVEQIGATAVREKYSLA